MKLTDERISHNRDAAAQLEAELYLDAQLADVSDVSPPGPIEFSTQDLRNLAFAVSELMGRADLVGSGRVRWIHAMTDRLQSEIAQRESA